ncbi:MAG TPA: hypothetical protein VG204_16540 [Terriglobia bacterium]|nr:hypothetical protein [Terriglobia bacterium]
MGGLIRRISFKDISSFGTKLNGPLWILILRFNSAAASPSALKQRQLAACRICLARLDVIRLRT